MIQHKKGQTIIIDLFIAISIFVLLIGATALIWHNYRAKLANDFIYEDLHVKAFQVTDLLVKSTGNPGAWENNISSAAVIGLAESDRVLDRNKVEAFANISHNEGVKLLNLGDYNYYFEIKDVNGGNLPNGDVKFNVERYVSYEGSDEIFKFTLWK